MPNLKSEARPVFLRQNAKVKYPTRQQTPEKLVCRSWTDNYEIIKSMKRLHACMNNSTFVRD